MTSIELKTNIMCGSCIEKVTPVFNETFGENNWSVDIRNSKKILKVSAEGISTEHVKAAVEKAGYKAESLT